MPVTAIHPGEYLAEELRELGMSAAEMARQLGIPTNRDTEIINGRRYHRRYGFTPRPFLRHHRGIPAESAKPASNRRNAAEIGQVD